MTTIATEQPPRRSPPSAPALGDTRIGPYEILAVLGRGAMGVVYRARHREHGAVVALKTSDGVSPEHVAGLRREIHALRQLQHPGIVRIQDQGIDAGMPWFAMDLVEGATLRQRLGDGPAAVLSLLQLFARLCAPLGYAHARGIVHGDLKPENVRIADDGTPVLVDFGLFARATGVGAREILEIGGLVRGSVLYIAPEQIRGELIDARADLYALGCMMYEAVTGTAPFAAGSVADILAGHLHVDPVPPSAREPATPSWLDELILGLIRKSRRQRIGYADVVAAAITRQLGAPLAAAEAGDELPYLYRPDFVGRDDTLTLLARRLEHARQGKGSFVFVHGESGIGKTRLAMQVTMQAGELGMMVVPGECVAPAIAATGFVGTALHPFRPLLAAVADHCREGGHAETERVLGTRGPVLAPYEPMLASLPGQDRQPAPPEVSPEAALERLYGAMVDTLGALAGATPLLLVLDDLQWADELSLRLLAALQRRGLEGLRVLVLGTFRDEELGDALRALADHREATTLELPRFGGAGIRRIVGDMLGLIDPPADFVGSLFSHAEGNPFFVSQYLQAAVSTRLLVRDPFGEWRLTQADTTRPVAGLELPRSLHTLVRLRLDGLTPAARALVEMASVLGHTFDEPWLEGAVGLPPEAEMEGVHELMRRHVLTRDGRGGLAFAHGKIREVAYEAIPAAARAELHGRAAATIERLASTDEARTRQNAALAHHWSRAVDVAGPPAAMVERALGALEAAGAQAMRSDARHDAVRFFEEAVRLQTLHRPPATDDGRRAAWERQLGDAYYRLGNMKEARLHLEAALAYMGERMPETTGRLLLSTAVEACRRVALRLPSGGQRAVRRRKASLAERARVYELLGFVQLLATDRIPSLVSILRSLNAAQGHGPNATLANSSAVLGTSVGTVLGRRFARRHFDVALDTARALDDGYCLGRVAHMIGFYDIGRALWPDAVRALEEARAAFERVGDRRWRETTELTMGNLHFFRRRSGGLVLYQGAGVGARERGDVQSEAWAAIGAMGHFIAQGEDRRAAECLEAIDRLLGGDLAALREPSSEFSVLAIRAVLALRVGDDVAARELACRAQDMLRGAPIMLYPALAGHGYTCQVLLNLWERAPSWHSPRIGGIAYVAALAVRRLVRFARFYPLARPGAWVWVGLRHQLCRRPRRARRAWERARHGARRLDMPYEEGLALYELGRHAADPAHAVALLDGAIARFETIGTRPERDSARAARARYGAGGQAAMA